MSSAALENLLQDFGDGNVRAGDKGLNPAALAAIVSARNDPPITQEMLAAEIAGAEAALEERLSAEHAAAFELERERHREEVAELNAQLGGQAGALIAERLQEMEASLVELATSAAARILAIHLTAQVQKRMVESLGQVIRGAIADSDGVRIRVRGPLSLYEALAAAVGDLARQLEFTESPGLDISVSVGDSLFETRLADWSAALTEALS